MEVKGAKDLLTLYGGQMCIKSKIDKLKVSTNVILFRWWA